jgi:hypothetical protein
MPAKQTKHTSQESPDGEAAPKRRLRWLGVKRGGLTLGVTALIAGTVVAHGLLLATHRWGATPTSERSREATLGQFHYVARGPVQVGIQGATFQLSVALLDDMAPLARLRLASHERKVQQNVEELLRRVHPGDFDDPTLAGLKRHLQTQINDALGVRAISEVLITDLVLEQRGPLPSEAAPAELASGEPAGAHIAP